MATVIDEAICLRHWEWSETSQTAAIFTRDHGVVRVLAKGSRRPKAAYSGGLELLTRAEAGMILKPGADLATLTSWDLRQSFPALRTVLAAYNTAMYMADLVYSFVRDHDPHTPLYDTMLAALEGMHSAEDAPPVLVVFQWRLLDECGFRPQIEADVRTDEVLGDEMEYLFSPSLGGVLAPSDGAVAGTWRVRAETLELLRRAAEPAPDLSGATAAGLDRANRLLASYARHVLGSQPATMPVLFGDRLAR